jgi:hypothetical protein
MTPLKLLPEQEHFIGGEVVALGERRHVGFDGVDDVVHGRAFAFFAPITSRSNAFADSCASFSSAMILGYLRFMPA